MQQLFKHEGVCVWTSDEYSVGNSVRDAVKANQCVAAGAEASGTILYGGVGPLPGGNIGVTLYTDSSCNDAYKGETTIDGLCAGTCSSNNNNNDKKRDLGGGGNNKNGVCGYYCYASAFNDAMNVWKQCQPCTAYTPGYYGSYQCSDAAGYNNCLQCMKFIAKAGSVPADLSDLYNAHVQQSITAIDVCGHTYGKFGYGYEDGIPSFSASMKIQKDALNLVSTYREPPADHSGPFFIISIVSVVVAACFFLYQFFAARKSKDAIFLRGNNKGLMS